ncbi:C-terminal binding protein [Bacillus sp. JCM 19041]|uniref:C-terminal binding protein n=1 Tax=Bacillus sp. JCM 19041 TaxID=1460637 RepID=UPI0006D00959
MITKHVCITDCDHDTIDQETTIFNNNDLSFSLHQWTTEDEIIKNGQNATVLINQYAPITRNVFEALPQLRLVVRYGVGVNNVDLQAATEHNVQVCNVPDYGTQEVADHALAFMLSFTRGIHKMTTEVKQGRWNYQTAVPLYRHRKQTIGVIGLGRIGTAFAQKAHALGCRIIGFDAHSSTAQTVESYIEQVDFQTLLKEADVVSIHCPLEKAHHLIGKDELRLMKKSAYLINVSRGGIIDEEALDWALSNNEIAGAAVDVLETEPATQSKPLFAHSSFLCTPHMAWYSEEAAIELKEKVAYEAVRFLKGEAVHYPVNRLEQ